MTAYPSHIHEARRAIVSRERATELLARYPRVSAEDRREILDFLKKGRHLDIGLLTTSERLRPNLDAFMADHKAHFRLRWVEGAAVTGALVALLAIVWLVWEALS
jgi:hypothetical protein